MLDNQDHREQIVYLFVPKLFSLTGKFQKLFERYILENSNKFNVKPYEILDSANSISPSSITIFTLKMFDFSLLHCYLKSLGVKTRTKN